MAARWRHLTSSHITQVAQVDTFEITNAGGGAETWTWTLTLDNGDTFTETFVDDGSPTLAEVTAGVTAAITTSGNPHFQRLSASGTSPNVTVTSDTAGRPFSLVLAASGTGTVSKTSTTANVGVNDLQVAQNWSDSAVPSAAEDVIFEAGSTHVTYRLNLSGTAIGNFVVEEGCSSKFGRLDLGQYLYLKIDPDLFDFRGSGSLCLFDLGSAAIAPSINATGSSGSTGTPAVFIKGSALTTLTIGKGSVGVAWLEDDTATVGTILAGSSVVSAATRSEVYLGNGLTLSTALSVLGGTCVSECAMPTVTVANGAVLTTNGTGGITTKLNCHGTVYANSSGTIAAADVSGVLDFTQNRTARTISLLNPKPGGEVRLGSWVTVTAWGNMPSAGEFKIIWVD